jgi:hypothetical protein
MNSVHLQRKMVQQLQAVGMQISQPQLVNLALWSQGLASSRDCHLPNLALRLPVNGRRKHLVQRLRRFLLQGRLGWVRSYGALVQHLFTNWQGREVALVMDRTDLGQQWSILLLGVAYRKRLLPLSWRILPFGGTSASVQISLLRQVQPYLPSGARVHYYGDCEFRAVDVQQCCRDYGWHWQVGLKGDTYVQLSEGEWRQLRSLPLARGQQHYWQQVYLTQQKGFGPVNLLADWSPNQEQPRFWALDLPAERQAWRRGRKRFWIEPGFRDWKSYGFDLERTQIDDAARLQMLVLALAVTTLWMIHIGDWLIGHGRDHELDRARHPDYSLFRLGRDYVQRAQTMNWSIPVGFTVSHA